MQKIDSLFSSPTDRPARRGRLKFPNDLLASELTCEVSQPYWKSSRGVSATA